MTEDWFRNIDWNADIASRFDEKLRRARRKEQYVRIQASTLAPTHPEIALELLARYFAMPDKFDHAQAHVDRATALQGLGRIDDAADAYEAALARESEFPNLQTQAYLKLPLLIATARLESRFDRALALLQQHENRLMFPVEHFMWHAAQALIMVGQGDRNAARRHARSALAVASKEHSGIARHASAGLVTDQYRGLLEEMTGLAAA